jgi:hypothetical protein
MILDENVSIIANNYIIQYYRYKGYDAKSNEKIIVKVSDLQTTSKTKINVMCDKCGNKKTMEYRRYLKSLNNGGYYTCSSKCSLEKIKQTNLKNYGKESTFQVEEFKNKSKQTCLENNGVEHPLKSNIIKNKLKQTNLKNYGKESTFQVDELKNKSKQTCLDIYGVEYANQSEFIKEKIKKTNLIKYNYTTFTQTIEYKNIVKQINIVKTLNYYKKIINNDFFQIKDYKDNQFSILHKKCNNIFEINRASLYDRLNNNRCLCTHCYPIGDNKSIKEKELINWIKELDISFIESDKTILSPKHLDIYIPSHNLGIEMNGLYWHSEIYKDKNYHLEKSLKCLEQGIQLLHIWEDEWVFKKDIVKSIILNKLNKIENRIYARQCEIRVIEDSKLVREFLDKNHIQGYCQSSIKLGLYHKNELVSLMTFGYRHTNAKKEFELIRFCNKINLNVIGSASKLFNYFKQNYHFNNLISYSDFRLFDGKMYKTLSFTKQHLSKPDYFWCKNLERKHRFNFNKQKLIKDGFDSSKTEVEIMHERGYYRIFGCGQYRWIYRK